MKITEKQDGSGHTGADDNERQEGSSEARPSSQAEHSTEKGAVEEQPEEEERAKEVEQLETSATKEELQLQLDTLVKQEKYEDCARIKKQIDALVV